MNTKESWKQWRKDYSRYMAQPQTQSNQVYSDSWGRIATDSITGLGNEIAKVLDIKEDLDIDCLLYCEHRINFWHKDNKNDLKQMFQRELACTAVAAHNTHESRSAGRVQEGGTGGICFGDATGYVRKVGRDEEGLG